MNDRMKEILLKQLQLLQEKSEKTDDSRELAELSGAMAAILNRVAELMSYGLLG